MIVVAAVFFEVSGISTMLKYRSAAGFKGVGFVLIGLMAGSLSALFHYYYKAAAEQPKTQDQIAVETLSKLPRSPKPPAQNT